MKTIPVFQFKVFSVNSGDMVLAPLFATLDAIKLANGVPQLHTQQLVPEGELDANGFHVLPKDE